MMSDLSEIDEEIAHLVRHLLQICHTHDVMITSQDDDDDDLPDLTTKK